MVMVERDTHTPTLLLLDANGPNTSVHTRFEWCKPSVVNRSVDTCDTRHTPHTHTHTQRKRLQKGRNSSPKAKRRDLNTDGLKATRFHNDYETVCIEHKRAFGLFYYYEYDIPCKCFNYRKNLRLMHKRPRLSGDYRKVIGA